MAENVRPPVAVRIVRPYDSEDAFIENELETIGKTSVVLVGAHARPTGVILRFEITLESGATLLRGEGRVLAHKDDVFRGQPGLSLRFTRLDPRSKALVDRATAIREGKAVPASVSVPSEPLSAPVLVADSTTAPPAMPVPTVATVEAHRGQSPASERHLEVDAAAERALGEALAAPTPAPAAPEPSASALASIPNAPVEAANRDDAEAANRDDAEAAMNAEAPPAQAIDATATEAAPARAIDATTAEALPAQAIDATTAEALPTQAIDATTTEAPPADVAPAAVVAPAPVVERPAATPAGTENARVLASPTNRGDLLARLRERSGALTDERRDAVLKARPRSTR